MHATQSTRYSHQGYSLVEVMVVLTIIGVLTGLAAPTYHRAIEQSRADIAAANLRAIWVAERLYWLDNHAYAGDLTTLSTTRLLDSEIMAAAGGYIYAITSADSNTFEATATRSGPSGWTGSFTINEGGALTGALQATGSTDITVGFQ